MKEYIAKVAEGENLTEEEAKGAMDIMLSGDATQAQIAAFLALERVKGETLDELAGFAVVLRDKAETISPKVDNYIDLVGTGGDRTFTFNVSTTSAFVVAAAGLPVAKHGNRSISSKSGAGDVLEALGVNIMADPKKVEECVEKTGIGFMFAQLFNKSMRYVGQARSEMGIRTVFNILGPLANPSRAKNMVVGVYSPSLTEKVATAMSRLGVERAYVVSGEDNAKITRAILDGTERGAKRDIVLLNAGATLYVGGVAESMEAGVKLAAEAIDSGAAAQKLEELVRVSNS